MTTYNAAAPRSERRHSVFNVSTHKHANIVPRTAKRREDAAKSYSQIMLEMERDEHPAKAYIVIGALLASPFIIQLIADFVAKAVG